MPQPQGGAFLAKPRITPPNATCHSTENSEKAVKPTQQVVGEEFTCFVVTHEAEERSGMPDDAHPLRKKPLHPLQC